MQYNEEAEWLKNLEEDLADDVERQNDIKTTTEMMKKQLRRSPNWKAPGPDGLQGFWLKNFTAVRECLTDQLNECFQTNTVPEWMTTGRTSLIVKDREIGPEATNFRPRAPREEEIVTR